MVKKTIFLLVLSFFLQFYLTSLQGKEYFAKERSRSRSESGVFGTLEPEPEPLKKSTRSRSRSRLGKKSGAGAAKKFAGSPALIFFVANKEIGMAAVTSFFYHLLLSRLKT